MSTGAWVAAAMENEQAMSENEEEDRDNDNRRKKKHREMRSKNKSGKVAGLPYYVWLIILAYSLLFFVLLLLA